MVTVFSKINLFCQPFYRLLEKTGFILILFLKYNLKSHSRELEQLYLRHFDKQLLFVLLCFLAIAKELGFCCCC